MNAPKELEIRSMMVAMSQFLLDCDKNKKDCLCTPKVYSINGQRKILGYCAARGIHPPYEIVNKIITKAAADVFADE